MDGRLEAKSSSDPRKAPRAVALNINIAKKAVKVEKAEHLVELVPDLLFKGAERVVLVAADRQCASLFDALVCPVVRVLTHFYGGAYLRGVNGVSFQGRADALMFGCLVALVAGADPFERLFRSCARVWWVFPAVLVVGSGILEVRFGDYWDFPIGYTVNGVCIAFFLLWCVRNPGSTVGRVLNTKLMSYLGVLSYSTYIWQQLFLNIHNSSIFGDTVLEKLPVCLVLVPVGACFSYYIVERPSLRLRDRVEGRVGGLGRRLDPEVAAD